MEEIDFDFEKKVDSEVQKIVECHFQLLKTTQERTETFLQKERSSSFLSKCKRFGNSEQK